MEILIKTHLFIYSGRKEIKIELIFFRIRETYYKATRRK